jgi:DNA topoisomerase I
MAVDTTALLALSEDSWAAARAARLRYVSDEQPGYTRQRWGRGFTYFDAGGNRITDPQQRARFEDLVIPPAWTDVWICPHENGHIQVTGRDDKGRKVYIYHPVGKSCATRPSSTACCSLARPCPACASASIRICAATACLASACSPPPYACSSRHSSALATTSMPRTMNSFGLTTLRQEHVDVNGAQLRFQFRGKSGKMQEVSVRDPRAARVSARCRICRARKSCSTRTSEATCAT